MAAALPFRTLIRGKQEFGSRVRHLVFILHLSSHTCNGSLSSGNLLRSHIHSRECLTRDCIAQSASLKINQFYIGLGHESIKHTRSDLVSIGPAQDYVHSGMASLEAFHRKRIAEPSFRSLLAFI